MHKKINLLKNKNILLCVCGSIAAYKICEIIRTLRKLDANVQVMMTKSSEKFIGKTTFAALSNQPVITNLFPDTPKAGLEHIELSFELDLIVVAPATANIIAKASNGVADDVVSTTLSVCEQPTLFVPAMNYKMWQNQATIRAVNKLKKMNKIVLQPEEGRLASLHMGEGRLPGIKKIMNAIRHVFEIPLPLYNKKILVTAGPTIEQIDPVRYITNFSSGKMGYALADAACNMGGEVILISGPVKLEAHPEANLVCINNAQQMLDEMNKVDLKKIDYIIMNAAVSDYRPEKVLNEKIKHTKNNLLLKLEPVSDIIKEIRKKTDAQIIAFALETNNGEKEAQRKLKHKGADFIVLNYANEEGAGFNANTNHVFIYSKNNQSIELKKDRKDRIAIKILEWVLKLNQSVI